MAKYKITLRKSVAKDLRGIATADLKRILGKLEELSADARCAGCTRLSAQERYRARVGLYRIIYEVQESQQTVHVVQVASKRIQQQLKF